MLIIGAATLSAVAAMAVPRTLRRVTEDLMSSLFAELQPNFTMRAGASNLPACSFIESLRPCARVGRQPQALMALLPQPAHHFIMQLPPVAAAFEAGIDKQRPDAGIT